MIDESPRFVCVICQQEKGGWYEPRAERTIQPICQYCEEVWGIRWQTLPASGTHMDRRLAAHLKAITARLETTAYHLANPIYLNGEPLGPS